MPRIQITPMAKVALYFLRAYLIILLLLILIAFIRKSQANSSARPATPPAASTRVPGRDSAP